MSDKVDIKPFPVKAKKMKSPKMMEQLGIKHPFSIGVFGCSGSGKTVCVCNMFTNKNMFRHFFDQVYLFSPTGSADDTFKHLGLGDERIITDDMIPKLQEIVEEQKNEVETKGIDKARKIALILEDLTSCKKLMNSKSFLQAFVQNRHLNISTIACCHKYNALNRTARLNCNHCFIFPCTLSEKKIIAEDNQTANFDKKSFMAMMDSSFEPEKGMIKPFLHINRKADIPNRFRKSFKKILGPDGFTFIFEEDNNKLQERITKAMEVMIKNPKKGNKMMEQLLKDL
jgi:hypothetical protein